MFQKVLPKIFQSLQNPPKNSSKAVPKFINGQNGQNGAPECEDAIGHRDQFVGEGLTCHLCNEMFHAMY